MYIPDLPSFMSSLNDEQRLAVEHPLGSPAAIIAGAGSGKTKCLQSRVVWLIANGVPPNKILVVTFTNKAANEIAERVLKAIPGIESGPMPKMSTIHSLALSAIRRNPLGFGLQEKVTPLDDYDQSVMMKKIMDREVKPEIDGDINVYRLLENIEYHRARGVGFAVDYTDEVHDEALVSHAGYHALEPIEIKLWTLFEIEKTKNGVVDFSDMLHLVVRRGRTDPVWLGKLQRQFDVVLQDETQDTSIVQWEFINMLLPPGNYNMFCVGDVSQSIMSFNGSCPQLLIDYSQGWRGVVPSLYRIARNHRSVPEIVRLANSIQAKMTATIPLKMESWRGLNNEKGTTKLLKANLPTDIAGAIASEIYRGSQDRKNPIPFRDNCILVRSAIQIRDLEGALVRFRIPYIVRGGRGLLQTEEIRDLLSYLRLVTNPNDFTAMVRALGVPKRGVGEVALEKIRKVSNEQYGGNLIDGCSVITKLTMFQQDMREISQLRTQPLEALNKIIQLTDYRNYIIKKYAKDKDKVKAKQENIDRFLLLVTGLLAESQMTTEDLVFQLTLDRGRENDKDGMVTISTIHSAKGLEWGKCFVSNVVEGSLPHRFSMGSESEIQEEMRLFYVAVTRARDSLTLCAHAMEQQGSNTRAVAPSRFLHMLGLV